MDIATFFEVCLWMLPALILAGPAWLVLCPPRRVRAWPFITRPLIATVCTQAAVYAFFYGVIFSVEAACSRAHPGWLLCYPVLCITPSWGWIPITFVSFLFFGIRQLIYHDDEILPTNRNA